MCRKGKVSVLLPCRETGIYTLGVQCFVDLDSKQTQGSYVKPLLSCFQPLECRVCFARICRSTVIDNLKTNMSVHQICNIQRRKKNHSPPNLPCVYLSERAGTTPGALSGLQMKES